MSNFSFEGIVPKCGCEEPVKTVVAKEWYTIEQLSDLLGLGIDRLNQLLPSLCNQLQSEIKTVGKEHRKLYSGDVLKALKGYQIKNAVPNATKDKQTALAGNVASVNNMTTQEAADVLNVPCDTIQVKARELGFAKKDVSNKWYTIEELANLSGEDVAYLRNNLKNMLINRINIDIEAKIVGREHRKLYSNNVLKALKEYQVKNSSSNALKNKQTAIEGNVSYIGNVAVNSLLDSPEALLTLINASAKKLLILQQENEAQKQQLVEQKPKVDYYDTVMQNDSTKDFGEIAKTMGDIGRNNLLKFARDNGILDAHNRPYQRYVDAKFFKLVDVKVRINGKDVIKQKTVAYQKGVDFLIKLCAKNGGVVNMIGGNHGR